MENLRAFLLINTIKDACKELVKHKINMVNPKGLRLI